jgi:hypothetical protein
MQFGAGLPIPSTPGPHPQPQPVFGALDPEGMRGREPAADGCCRVGSRFVVAGVAGEAGLRFDWNVNAGGFTQPLKGGDELQCCSSRECRQPFFGYAVGGLKNKLIARRQDLDRMHEFLFSGFACFVVHAGNCGREGWTSAIHAKIFREIADWLDDFSRPVQYRTGSKAT